MALRLARFSSNLSALSSVSVRAMSGNMGSGAGKGGGDGGSIRKAGGKFGEMEAAREDQYFRKLQQEQLKDLKKSMKATVKFHKEQIEDHEQQKQFEALRNHHRDELIMLKKRVVEHEESIAHHKRKIKDLEDLAKKTDE